MPPRRKPTLAERNRRRALTLLAGSPDGATEAIMMAHGFTIPFMVELVQAGYATAHPERIRAGGKLIEVTTLKITDAGRAVIASRG